MNDIIDFLTSKEIIVVYIVVAVACLLCFVIYLIDKNYAKRKRRQNTKKLNKLVEDVNTRLREENKVVKESIKPNTSSEPIMIAPSVDVVSTREKVVASESLETKDIVVEKANNSSLMDAEISKVDKNIDELIYTDIEPDREQATRELMQLTLELEKAEKEKSVAVNNTSTISIADYENSQEENAIISLEELTKKSSEMYLQNEVSQYADEGNEPISLSDLELRKQQAMSSELVEEKKEEIKRDSEYYSQMISPVFNYNNKNDIENTADYDKFDEELQKTQEFLISLKDLQSKLNS